MQLIRPEILLENVLLGLRAHDVHLMVQFLPCCQNAQKITAPAHEVGHSA
jgi:hypothetical protein